jgi:hypothetical protein
MSEMRRVQDYQKRSMHRQHWMRRLSYVMHALKDSDQLDRAV